MVDGKERREITGLVSIARLYLISQTAESSVLC